MEFIATNAEELSRVDELLHDAWLELPEAHDLTLPGTVVLKGRGETTPFRGWRLAREIQPGPTELTLRVDNVTAVDIADDALVGELNLAHIRLDDSGRQLEIVGHLPVRLALKIESLAIALTVRSDQGGTCQGL